MSIVKTVTISTLLALSAFSSATHAQGLIASVLQGAGVISPQEARELDRRHDQFKRAVPIYGAAERAGSTAVQGAAAGLALNYGGPAGLAAGQVVTNAFTQRILQEQRLAAENQARLYQWHSYCRDLGRRYDAASHSCF